MGNLHDGHMSLLAEALKENDAAIITIYDRYGKLIKEFNSSNFNWNGTLNGYQLPADDYWFQLTFKNNKKIRGHFSLKR